MVFGREPLDLLMQRLNLLISLPRTDELPQPLCWVGVGACIAMAKGVGSEKLFHALVKSDRVSPIVVIALLLLILQDPPVVRGRPQTTFPTDLGPSF